MKFVALPIVLLLAGVAVSGTPQPLTDGCSVGCVHACGYNWYEQHYNNGKPDWYFLQGACGCCNYGGDLDLYFKCANHCSGYTRYNNVPSCEDKLSTCVTDGQNGGCLDANPNHEYYRTQCTQTCGTCNNARYNGFLGCEDIWPSHDCAVHRQNGGCSDLNGDHDKFRTMCQATCGYCNDRKYSCQDLSSDCPVHVANGGCSPGNVDHDFYRSLCPRSCGVCDVPEYNPHQGCEDQILNCKTHALNGGCQMENFKSACASTCGLCNDPKYNHVVSTATCHPTQPVDLIFVLDGSGSITSESFAQMKNFVAEFTKNFDVGNDANQMRIGIVQYSSDVNVQISLTGSLNNAIVEYEIRNMQQKQGFTFTGKGIDMAAWLFSQQSTQRQGVLKIMVTITDGASSDNGAFALAADKAKYQGIHMFSVGVGNYNPVELNTIASLDEFVYTYNDFAALASAVQELANSICDKIENKLQRKCEKYEFEESTLTGQCHLRTPTSPIGISGGKFVICDDGGNGAIITDVTSQEKAQYYMNIRYSSPTFEGRATLRSNGNDPTDMTFPESKDINTGDWTLASFPVDVDPGTNVISVTIDNDHQGPSFDYFTLCTGDETVDDQRVELRLNHDGITFTDYQGQKYSVKKDLAAHLGLSESKVQLSIDRLGWERRALSGGFPDEASAATVSSFFARVSTSNAISEHVKTKLDDTVALVAYLSDSNRTSLTFTSASVGDFVPLSSSPTQTPTSLPTQMQEPSDPTQSPTALEVKVLDESSSSSMAMLFTFVCFLLNLL